MSYLTANPVTLLETRKALATAIGYPVKGRCYRDGAEVFDVMPAEYVPGRWCEYEPEIVVSDDGTVAAMQVNTTAESYLAESAKGVQISARSALPVKISEVLSRREQIDPPEAVTKEASARTK